MNLCGHGLLQNDFKNTLCEKKALPTLLESARFGIQLCLSRFARSHPDECLSAELGFNENYYTPGSYWSLYSTNRYKLIEMMDQQSLYDNFSPGLDRFHTKR